MKSGKIYLIGAGPGDPGLFTIKGKMLLEQGEVVIYDRLVGEEILSYASPEAELIYVGKESGRHALTQDEINLLMVRKANFSFTKKASVTPVTTRFSFRSVNGEVTMAKISSL
jgi:siroheme synthase